MKKNMMDNLMSYVENGIEKGIQTEFTKIEVKDETIYFEGEVEHSKKEGYNNDEYCKLNGRVKYITRDESTIIAIDVDYEGSKNNKNYEYGEIISFEQLKGEKDNVVLKTVLNKRTNQTRETFYQSYGKDIDLLKHYIHNCYNPVPYIRGEYLVQKVLKK